MKSGQISTDRITVLEFVERPHNKISDSRDRLSIEKHGILQPLVLVPDGDRLLLADGLRRLRIGKSLGIGKVPYVLAPAPRGRNAEEYTRELRLALDIHRQDLTPSQLCAQAMDLKERFQMTNKELAAFMLCDQDTITNRLSVRNYLPEIVQALDSGRMTMGAAKVFDGMSEKGQRTVWKRHGEELLGPGKHAMRRRIRTLYPPSEHPAFYRQPELVAKRLKRKADKRRGRPAPVTAEEKRRLMASLDMRSIELEEGTREEKRLKREIEAATVPIHAIMRSEKLRGMLSPEMVEEFARYCEVY